MDILGRYGVVLIEQGDSGYLVSICGSRCETHVLEKLELIGQPTGIVKQYAVPSTYVFSLIDMIERLH